MQIVSTAWIDGSAEEFELKVGLGLHAPHGRASAAAPLRVFVLDGYQRLPASYRSYLRNGHVELLDAAPLARAWAPRLGSIAARLNRYETFCFLRWPVLRAALAGAPFLHIDSDVYLQPSLATVAAALQGRTANGGSPCFMAVSDSAWLDALCNTILAFGQDPDGTEAALGYAGNSIRRHIGSDQDLLQACQAAGRLPRGDFGRLAETHALFINPLFPRFGGASAPIVAEQRDGQDIFSGRPVLFWHLQYDFARYVGSYLAIRRVLRDGAVPRVTAQVPGAAPTAEGTAFNMLRMVAMEQFRRELGQRVLDMDRIQHLVARSPLDFMARAVAGRHFLLRGEARELFSEKLWWERGVFA